MNNMNELAVITTKDVEDKLVILRNQKVLLDCDVADLYGVKTKEVNQAVKNNPEKFPYGYIFVLDKYEKAEVVKNIDHQLHTISELCGYHLANHHHALADAEACAWIAREIL